MNRIYTAIVLLMFFAALQSCNSKQSAAGAKELHGVKQRSLSVKYAKGFSVDYYERFKIITVKDWRDSAKVLAQYVLLPKGKAAPLDFPEAVRIETPVTKVICLSTNQVAEMKRLQLLHYVAGITGPQLIYDKSIREAVKSNIIANLGQQELNYEKLIALHPSFVFTSGGFDGGSKLKTKLDALHIDRVLQMDYAEQDPLARAEWIKFMAVFFNREQEADSLFEQVETSYLALKTKAQQAKDKPTVFCNIPFKEVWYMPCGENYMAHLIADAGGDFLWKNAPATNGLNLNLDYEAVYNRAAHAQYWLNTGMAASLYEIKQVDRKNALFDAFKTGQVYNNDLRKSPEGGFDFWESGVVNPDKILADLIFIFHPELLPGHQLFYYRKLK